MNREYNDNSNNNNVFIKLSHLLLKKIISFLDDHIDRIRFTLVCRRWFQERLHYLVLAKYYSNGSLNSYINCCEKDNITKQLNLNIVENPNHFKNRLNYTTTDTFMKESVISPIFSSVSLLEIKDFDISRMKSHLERSNVRTVSLRRYNLELQPGSLPSNIDTLGLSDYSFPLQSNHLPLGLKKLLLYNYEFDLIDRTILPVTLTTIEYCPLSWIKHLKHLPYLESLVISVDFPVGFMEQGDFPNTLTKLDLSLSTFGTSNSLYIPSSIKHLTISSTYDVESNVLPRDAHYDYLCISDFKSAILPGHLPANIKELVLFGYNQPLVPGSLPFGIETLRLPSLKSQYLCQGVIPASTKNLYIFENDQEHPVDIRSIPNSVETFSFPFYKSEIDFQRLPDSIRTIHCRIELLNRYGVGSIKSTIIKIDIYGVNSFYSLERIDEDHFILTSTSNIAFINLKELENTLYVDAKNMESNSQCNIL
ncbi:hypothetical protein PPL_12512 [Heterostelium album PN500]|uniref:FNIP repeat-containing protein n=1 Tax=Heterostelium pallidum (strain ATCC 26659 / Pp 5 / PN500) TaxID=670386 RepID=D3BMT9_HETP5|nr:hypothetical protein PPL_12512 [Heterostelium album PN500]EFA77301.1 hypothetical protein PPL_12512 [Heterostelium album PN500]|eukprot:XP_020429430.1 hypothetical protein PPL_12512 [Heterostelium album PN500]